MKSRAFLFERRLLCARKGVHTWVRVELPYQEHSSNGVWNG